MTEKQKENLRKAREKSLAVRRAKKLKNENKKISKSHILTEEKEDVKVMAKPVPIPSVAQQAPMSFDYFVILWIDMKIEIRRNIALRKNHILIKRYHIKQT